MYTVSSHYYTITNLVHLLYITCPGLGRGRPTYVIRGNGCSTSSGTNKNQYNNKTHLLLGGKVGRLKGARGSKSIKGGISVSPPPGEKGSLLIGS